MSSRIELPSSAPARGLEVLFGDFIKQGLYLKGWSKRTIRTYNQALTSYRSSLPELVNSSELPTKASLESWIIGLKKKGLTPGGINMYIRTFNSFLTWLLQEGHIPSTLKLKLLPNPTKPLRGFSDSEIRSLLSFRARGFTELRTWTLINLLLDTGCRIEEILTLKSTQVDFDNLLITVTGKGSKERRVPLSFEARKNLYRYSQRKKESIFCFGTRSGHRLSYRNTYRDIKTLCAKAGVVGEHVHPHAFRHNFACTYIRRGGDIYRLSRILGHSSITTTTIYLRSMGIEQIGENHSSLSPLSKAY